MYVVITKVQLKPGEVDNVRDLFSQTNPALVKDQVDWLKAIFSVDRNTNQVTVLAFWQRAESYQSFRENGKYQQVMSQFAPYFAGPPQVTINEILLEM